MSPGGATADLAAGYPYAWHLGGLHPFEQLLVLVLAFGPFLVLGAVVAVQRRRAVAAEEAERREAQDGADQDGADQDGADQDGAGPDRTGQDRT